MWKFEVSKLMQRQQSKYQSSSHFNTVQIERIVEAYTRLWAARGGVSWWGKFSSSIVSIRKFHQFSHNAVKASAASQQQQQQQQLTAAVRALPDIGRVMSWCEWLNETKAWQLPRLLCAHTQLSDTLSPSVHATGVVGGDGVPHLFVTCF